MCLAFSPAAQHNFDNFHVYPRCCHCPWHLSDSVISLDVVVNVFGVAAQWAHLGSFNPLKPELNPTCYLPALLGAHHFLHVSRIRVNP